MKLSMMIQLPHINPQSQLKESHHGNLGLFCDRGGGMAHIRRLIFCCVGALVALLPVSSFAVIPKTVSYQLNSAGATYSSFNGACNAYLASFTSAGSTYVITSCTSGGVYVRRTVTADGSILNYSASINSVYSCSANSTVSGSSCLCTSPYVEDASHTSCVAPVPSVCSWATGQSQMIFGTFQIERGKELCSSGCAFSLKVDAGASLESSRLSGTSPWIDTRTMGDFSGTGSVCSSSTTGAATGTSTPSPYPPGEDGTPPKDTCPAGKIGGTVNGLFTCVTPGETIGTKNSVTTNNDGTDTKKDTVGKSTSCVGTQCTTTTNTTTTTTNNSSGVVTTTTAAKSEVQTKGDYCKANATDKTCLGVGSGLFSGTCGAVPACSGDAVMCAIAAATFSTNCAFTLPAGTEALSEVAAYAAAKLKTGSQLSGLPGSETVDVGSSKFDQTELLGAAQGMHDVTVVILGRTIVLPFSGVNVWLSRFGLALQAVTFLVCAYIVTGQRSRA